MRKITRSDFSAFQGMNLLSRVLEPLPSKCLRVGGVDPTNTFNIDVTCVQSMFPGYHVVEQSTVGPTKSGKGNVQWRRFDIIDEKEATSRVIVAFSRKKRSLEKAIAAQKALSLVRSSFILDISFDYDKLYNDAKHEYIYATYPIRHGLQSCRSQGRKVYFYISEQTRKSKWRQAMSFREWAWSYPMQGFQGKALFWFPKTAYKKILRTLMGNGHQYLKNLTVDDIDVGVDLTNGRFDQVWLSSGQDRFISVQSRKESESKQESMRQSFNQSIERLDLELKRAIAKDPSLIKKEEYRLTTLNPGYFEKASPHYGMERVPILGSTRSPDERGEVEGKFLGPPVDEGTEDPRCRLRGLVVGPLLAKGSSKLVYALCSSTLDKNQACEESENVLVVAKAPAILAPFAKDPELEIKKVTDYVEIEFRLMQKLASTPRGSEIVMPVLDYWTCPNTGRVFAIQPRAQEDFLELGVRQKNQAFEDVMLFPGGGDKKYLLVFTLDQVLQAFRLTTRFHDLTDSNGRALQLIHGDMKPNNILVLKDGSLRIADLGTSGSWRLGFKTPQEGYTADWADCKWDETGLPVSPLLAKYFDRWQLELVFRLGHVVLMEVPSERQDRSQFQVIETMDDLLPFIDGREAKSLIIPAAARLQLDERCEKNPKKKKKWGIRIGTQSVPEIHREQFEALGAAGVEVDLKRRIIWRPLSVSLLSKPLETRQTGLAR
jgi:hypothetical protein